MRLDYRAPAAVAAAVLGVAACNEGRAITTEPFGEPAYGFVFAVSATNMPGGTARIPRPTTAPSATADTISVTLTGLDSLASAFYAVWLTDSAAQNFKRATGSLRITVTDTTTNAQGDPVPRSTTTTTPNVTAFKNGGPRHTMTFITTRQQSGLAATDSVQTVLISIEGSQDATTPSPTRRPLWARRQDAAAADTTPAGGRRYARARVRFGNFASQPANSYLYVPTGRGRVAVRGNVLIVNDSSLGRPPLGYYYAAWGVKMDAEGTPTDTILIGEQTAPYPNRDISLRNADSVLVSSQAQAPAPPVASAGDWAQASPGGILAAANRIELPGQTPFRGLALVFVTLESKHADPTRMGPVVILRADVPDIVRAGPPGSAAP